MIAKRFRYPAALSLAFYVHLSRAFVARTLVSAASRLVSTLLWGTGSVLGAKHRDARNGSVNRKSRCGSLKQLPLGMCDNPAMSLTLVVEHSEGATVVRLSGKLVAGVTDILVSEVRRLIPEHKRIVLDLTDLVYMDSMGLGSIIRLYVSAKSAGACLELINLSKRIRDLLGVTNVLSIFEACGEPGARMR